MMGVAVSNLKMIRFQYRHVREFYLHNHECVCLSVERCVFHHVFYSRYKHLVLDQCLSRLSHLLHSPGTTDLKSRRPIL